MLLTKFRRAGVAALAPALLALAALLLASPGAQAQRSVAAPIYQPNLDSAIDGAEEWLADLEKQGWFLRGQMTTILQGHLRMRSPYQGPSSLDPRPVFRNTQSIDLVIGRRLWDNAEAVVVPMLTRGFGMSNAVGVASFPNNEAFRLGSRDPYFLVSRAFIRQTIDLSFDADGADPDPMRFTGPLARERLTITAGKVSVWDFFDDNRYAHDARGQFMGWGMVGAAGFDYAADARGFTNGLVLEWEDGTWAVRQGAFMIAKRANGLALDQQVFKGYQTITEVDRYWRLGSNRPGAVRFLAGASSTRAPTWQAMSASVLAGDEPPAVAQRRSVKPNLAMNAEQELTDVLGAFLRLGWNDGLRRNWMYTEQDWSVSAGLALNGLHWDRADDTIGLGFNVGGISRAHRQFLEAGGIGFITGDGRLRYRPEAVMETYYDAKLYHGLNAAVNLQLVQNPGYNADRGPAVVLGLRLRAAF
jgi:high affinity Mn2+ porin